MRRVVVPKRCPPIKDTWWEHGGRAPQPEEGCWVGIDPSIVAMGLVAVGRRSYYWRLHKPKGIGGGERLAVHRHLLADFFDHVPTPDRILLEGPGYESHELFSAGIVRSMIIQTLYDLGLEDQIHWKPIAPNTLKKFVTKDGHANKTKVKRAVRKQWGTTITDHNVADAYGIAQAAMTLSTGEALYSWQLDALRGLVSPDDATVDHRTGRTSGT